MATGSLKFTADVNKTVTVEGEIYSITVPALPDGITMLVNEVQVVAGQPVQLTQDSVVTFEVAPPPVSIAAFHIADATASYTDPDGISHNIANESSVILEGGTYDFTVAGTAQIPSVNISGAAMESITIQPGGAVVTADEFPYTYTPQPGVSNSLYLQGTGGGENAHSITITGTQLREVTVDSIAVQLPHTFTPTKDTVIAAAGITRRLTLQSQGGTKINDGSTLLTDGNGAYNTVIDMTTDHTLTLDGEHEIITDADDITYLEQNGVRVTSFPSTARNRLMTLRQRIQGAAQGQLQFAASYIEDGTLDGTPLTVTNGNIAETIEIGAEDRILTVRGSQPRTYRIHWQDNGSTQITMNGNLMVSGTSSIISGDVFVEAVSTPIPVNFENHGEGVIEINGRPETADAFTYMVSRETEVDIRGGQRCMLTITWEGGSCVLAAVRDIIEIWAPEVPGRKFRMWSSEDIGIENPELRKTILDLRSYDTAIVHANYDYATLYREVPPYFD